MRKKIRSKRRMTAVRHLMDKRPGTIIPAMMVAVVALPVTVAMAAVMEATVVMVVIVAMAVIVVMEATVVIVAMAATVVIAEVIEVNTHQCRERSPHDLQSLDETWAEGLLQIEMSQELIS
jgi:hypothetical protein